MANFPRLIPAFTVQIYLDKPTGVGALAHGSTLIHAAFLPGQGSLRSEPGYPLLVDAAFVHGADYIHRDPDGRHVRLDVSSLLRDKASGATIRYDYSGVIDITGPAGKIFSGAADAATTEFGDAFTHVKFESAAPELAALQHKVYVGSGRFVVEPSKPVVVEYKISEVAL